MLQTIFRKTLRLRYLNKNLYNFSNMQKTETNELLSKMRVDFNPGSLLDEDQMEANPFDEFKIWFKATVDSKQVAEPNAMTICTATKDGIPNARPVLLKGIDEKGFVFYTNYNSCKSKEIQENPNVCLVFFWDPLSRVVRIQGKAEKVSSQESDEYFHLRPRDAQIGAWTSNQSEVIEGGRKALEEKFEAKKKEFEKVEVIPRPEHWGGWLIIPYYFEFWQGQTSRLHDRVVYKKDTNGWKKERLSP